MFKKLLYLTLFFFAALSTKAQLTAGDIMFVAYNADGDNGFAIVSLVDIPAGTTIYFTDNEWNGSAIGSGGAFNDDNEGEMTWTSGASTILAGKVIVFDKTSDNTNVSYGATIGGVANGTLLGEIDANISDEVIYAFLGTDNVTPTTFLSAIANDGFDATNGQLTNTGLTEGVNATAITGNEDVMQYTGATANDLPATRALIADPTNWSTEDGGGDQSADGGIDFPPSLGIFTIYPNGTFSSSSLAISDDTISKTNNYTFTQTVPTDVTYDMAISAGALVTIDVPNGDLSSVRLVGSSFNGVAIAAFITQTATTITFAVPATGALAEGATFDIVLAEVINYDTEGVYSLNTVTVENNDGGTNSYDAYGYILNSPTGSGNSCANATYISDLTNGACRDGDNTSAIVDVTSTPSCFSDPTGRGIRGQWWKFTADLSSARIFVRTRDTATMRAPIVALYSACGTEISCNAAASTAPSVLMEENGTLTPGNTYYVLVANNEGASPGTNGDYDLCIENSAPTNDNFCTPIPILDNTCILFQSNFLSTSDGVTDGCAKADKSVWYSMRVPADGSIEVDVLTTGFDLLANEGMSNPKTALQSIATGTCPNPLTWNPEDNTCTSTGSLSETVTYPAGSMATFSVTSPSGNDGAFHFCTGTADINDYLVLPIDLIDFSVENTNSSVLVEWSTATETNNNYFIIEKSYNGIDFEEIARIDGAGNSQDIIDYSYTDTDLDMGINYYRLKQVDYDGKSEVFSVKAVDVSESAATNNAILYPNPVEKGGVVKLKFSKSIGSTILLVFRDVLGKEHYIQAYVENGNTAVINTNNIPSGVYFIIASQSNELISNRLVVM